MSAEGNRSLLDIAADRGLLTPDQIEELRSIAAESGSQPTDLAIERNWVDAATFDSLKPLAESRTLLPGYEFFDLLGEGAVGSVYVARQTKLDRLVALKLLKLSRLGNEKANARSHLEAQLSAKLRHPNIVATYDYGVHEGRIHLAMELIEGETLLDRIDREMRLAPKLSLQIIRQAAGALAYAEEQGVIHRDIKPANLLLTKAVTGVNLPPGVPLVKVSDFGLAYQMTQEEDARLTAAGSTLGTPSYAAPEQLSNSSVDARADIYALGATFYHMLTGMVPFHRDNVFRILSAKMAGKETWRDNLPGDLPDNVVELFRAMTAHKLDDRIASHHDLMNRIDEMLDGPAIFVSNAASSVESITDTLDVESQAYPATAELSPEETPTSEVLPPQRNRFRTLITVAVVFAVLALGGLAAVWYSQAPPMRVPVESTRWTRYLFDGFQTPVGARQQGVWKPDKDSDEAPVLSGTNGWLMLELPKHEDAPFPYYRIHFGVDALESQATEIHFGQTLDGDAKGSRYVIRLADGQAQVGEQNDEEEFEPLGPPEKLAEANSAHPVYQNILLERQPWGWFVAINGEYLPGIPATPDSDPWRVMLATQAGTAHFENLNLTRWSLPTTTDP